MIEPFVQVLNMEDANLELTLQVRGGRVVGHQEAGDDLHITVAVAEVAHCAVAEYFRENQPPAKRPCRLRPIPIKVEPPITITLSSDEEEEREYVEPELVLPKQEPSEEEEEQ